MTKDREGFLSAFTLDGTVGSGLGGVLLRLSPDGSSFEVRQGGGEHWAHPTIANGRLYLRHGEALMVYDIAEGGAG